MFYKLGYPIQHTFRDPKGWGCAWANFFVRLLFIVRAHTSWPLPSLQETLSHQIYAMQPPKFASKLPQLIALLQQITPSCNKCPPLLKISTRLITTRRNLRKLTLFLSETEKGSSEEEYNENVSPFQIYLIFFLLSAYFESQIFCTRPWHSLVWYFNAFKVAGCLRVCLGAWQNDLQSGFDADSVTTRFSIQHPT